MTWLPSSSLVRAAPPPTYGVVVPATEEGFRRLRVHAPLPDASDGVLDAPGTRVCGGEERKAYYEVSIGGAWRGGSMKVVLWYEQKPGGGGAFGGAEAGATR